MGYLLSKSATDESIRISAMGSPRMTLPGDVEVLVRRRDGKVYGPLEYVRVRDLTRSHYMAIPVNRRCAIPRWEGTHGRSGVRDDIREHLEDERFWYLMGRYAGNGVSYGGKPGEPRRRGCYIAVSADSHTLGYLIGVLEGLGYRYKTRELKTKTVITVSSRALYDFTRRYGPCPAERVIDDATLSLPKHLLCPFIAGVVATGFRIQSLRRQYTTRSLQLALTLGQAVMKAYGVPYGLYDIPPHTRVHDGVPYEHHAGYTVRYLTVPGRKEVSKVLDGYGLFRISGIESVQEPPEIEADGSGTEITYKGLKFRL